MPRAGDLGVKLLDGLGVLLNGLGLIGGEVLLQSVGGVEDCPHGVELALSVLLQDLLFLVGSPCG